MDQHIVGTLFLLPATISNIEFVLFATNYWEVIALSWLSQYKKFHPGSILKLHTYYVHKKDALYSIVNLFVADILGEPLFEDQNYEELLIKLRLCDICLLEEFVNAYIGYIFKLSTLEKKIFWIRGFF